MYKNNHVYTCINKHGFKYTHTSVYTYINKHGFKYIHTNVYTYKKYNNQYTSAFVNRYDLDMM